MAGRNKRSRWHRGCVLGLVALGLLVPAASASAATFYVDDSAGSPDIPCTNPNPNDACMTINAAIMQARDVAFSGGDTIMVAAGDYPEQVQLTDDLDSGNVIDGAGTANSAATGTRINPTLADGGLCCAVLLGFTTAPPEDNLTLRDVRVQLNQSGTNTDKTAITVNATNTAIQNVFVDMNTTLSTVHAVAVNAGPTTIDGLTNVGNWKGPGVGARITPSMLTIRDSTLNGPAAPEIDPALSIEASWDVLVQRTRLIRSGLVGNSVSSFAGNLTMESSTITGGLIGIGFFAGGGSREATIRNTTIDVGNLKVNDAGSFRAVSTDANGAGAQTNVVLDSSIALETQQATVLAGGASAIACSFSDVPFQTQAAGPTAGTISCGNAAGNSSSTPAQLFMPGPANYLLLAPGSPALDSGSPAALGGAESATDAGGNPRVLDGNGDCLAVRDKGAFEAAGFAAPCPPPAAGAGPTGQRAAALKKCKKKKRKKRNRCRRRARRLPA